MAHPANKFADKSVRQIVDRGSLMIPVFNCPFNQNGSKSTAAYDSFWKRRVSGFLKVVDIKFRDVTEAS